MLIACNRACYAALIHAGHLYVDPGSIPSALMNATFVGGSAAYYGLQWATGPHSVQFNDSTYLTTVAGIGTQVLYVTGAFATQAALARFQLYDGVGNKVTTDDSTVCRINCYDDATGAVFPLGFPNECASLSRTS